MSSTVTVISDQHRFNKYHSLILTFDVEHVDHVDGV
jgi:hypothetical protein